MRLSNVGSFLLIAIATSIATSVSFAGPSVSGGVPPHPAIITASIEAPVAGIDYPTDSQPTMTAVLALYDSIRIPIIGINAQIVKPTAGLDYPTDSTPPVWSAFQKILLLQSQTRVPMRLMISGATLNWSLPTGAFVPASEIAELRISESGIDFPTDSSTKPFFILVMKDGGRVRLL